MNKLKKTPLARMKFKAARVFQRWAVLRDCDEYQKNGMICPCVTCGKIKNYSELQGGHFRAGRGNSILFLEDGCHAQCGPCNGHFRNQSLKADDIDKNYEAYMVKRYGQKRVNEIDFLRGQPRKFTFEELSELYLLYSEKILDLGGIVPKV